MKMDLIKKNIYWIIFILFIIVICIVVYNMNTKETFSVSISNNKYNLDDIKNKAIIMIEGIKDDKFNKIVDTTKLKENILDIPQEIFDYHFKAIENFDNEGFTVGSQSITHIIYLIFAVFVILSLAMFNYFMHVVLTNPQLIERLEEEGQFGYIKNLIFVALIPLNLIILYRVIEPINEWVREVEDIDDEEQMEFILQLFMEGVINNANRLQIHQPPDRILNGWRVDQVNRDGIDELYRNR